MAFVAHPAARRVRAHAVGAQLDAEVAVAAALHARVRGLPQDREVAREQVGPVPREPAEPVELGRDLLVVVPHPRDVDGRVDELRGELQLHGDARLHVDGAAPPQVALAVDGLEPRRQVAVDRHGVEVPGDHDAALPAEVRAGHDRVAVADHLEVVGARQGLDHEVRQAGLVARHARHVADRPGDRHRVGGEVERWHGRGGSRHATSLRIRVRRSRAGGDRRRHGCRAPPPRRYAGLMPATTDTASSPARRTAWGHGLATIADDGTVLDTWFPSPALGAPDGHPRSRPSCDRSPAATTAAR